MNRISSELGTFPFQENTLLKSYALTEASSTKSDLTTFVMLFRKSKQITQKILVLSLCSSKGSIANECFGELTDHKITLEFVVGE